MGIMTISMNDEDEASIRRLAESKYGHKKGAISKTIAEAVQHDLGEIRQKRLKSKFIQLLDKGLHLGGKAWKREDLYDRA